MLVSVKLKNWNHLSVILLVLFFAFGECVSVSLYLFLLLFYFMSMVSFLHVCPYTPCMSGVYRGQKRASDALDMALQMNVRYHVHSDNQT